MKPQGADNIHNVYALEHKEDVTARFKGHSLTKIGVSDTSEQQAHASLFPSIYISRDS